MTDPVISGDMRVVDRDAMQQDRRRAMYAYIGSFIGQIIAFTLGWNIHAFWPQIVARF